MTMNLRFGRIKARSKTNNSEPTVSKWVESSSGTSGGFNGFRNNNNDANNNSNISGGFGLRNGGSGFGVRGGFGGSGTFGSSNDGVSRACYNCNKTGHMRRDCPAQRKENRGGRGGSNLVRNREGFNSGDGRGGFNSRGNRGGSNSGDRDYYNCDKPGHQSRKYPEPRKSREGGGQKNDRGSDGIFDQPDVRGGGQLIERYIPPPLPTIEDDIFGETVSKGKNFAKYHRTQVRCTPEGKVKPIELYEEANLSAQILSNISRAHFEEPTPIQRYTIPCIQQQDDIIACAQTGSGKTAAFLLPIISNILEYHSDELLEKHHPPSPLCLILSPTRELALQTEREVQKFAYQTAVIPCSAVGGHDMTTVSDRLREDCHVLSATTGRLKDMIEKGRVSLKKVKYFVLDEADRMLDTRFEPDICKLEDLGLPSKDERVTSMFFATIPPEVQQLAKHFLRDNYVFLAVGTVGGANEDISQTVEEVRQREKKDRLFHLLDQNLKSERCLVLVETERSADYIGALLSQKKLTSTTIHGDRTQRQRSEAVHDFTNGKCSILVATSVAARGLDFPSIGYVVNFDLLDSIDFYIHYTDLAGNLGKSISFFDPERDSDRKLAPDLVLKLSETGQEIPEFLRRCADGTNTGFNRGGLSTRNIDMETGSSHFGSRAQAASRSGDTASAGAADEEWD